MGLSPGDVPGNVRLERPRPQDAWGQRRGPHAPRMKVQAEPSRSGSRGPHCPAAHLTGEVTAARAGAPALLTASADRRRVGQSAGKLGH